MKKIKLTSKVLIGFVAACLLAGCASGPKGQIVNSEASVTKLVPVQSVQQKANQGIYYCIFVRSFADSDGDGIGDFNGITKKLDYLNDGDDSTTTDLGVTGIWLMPIFPSQSYHGYDVDDYFDVNPHYGTMADFENLVAECKKRGISVILDMTCNHSSTYTQWFQDGRNPEDPHHSWYRWITPDDSRYNINQQMWGHKVWNEDRKYTGNYYAGLFGNHMPDFNLDSPELRNEFKKVSKFWMDKGVAGFRYDAAGHVYNSAKTPGGTNSIEKGVEWWKEITEYNKSLNPDSYNVGEVWEKNSICAQYIAGLGSDFHFGMGENIILDVKNSCDGGNAYANGLQGEYERLKLSNPDYIDAPFLTNHDQPRAAGQLRGNLDMCKVAASMYLLTEGVPFMYYGEEIGMMSGTDDPSKRTPMLWNTNMKNPSTGVEKPKDKLQTTWSESRYNKKVLSVAEQSKDENSLLQYYKRLIRLRTSHSGLYNGRFTAVSTGNGDLSSWQMSDNEETLFIMINVTDSAVTAKVPEQYKEMNPVFKSNTNVIAEKGSDGMLYEVTIPARGTLVISNRL